MVGALVLGTSIFFFPAVSGILGIPLPFFFVERKKWFIGIAFRRVRRGVRGRGGGREDQLSDGASGGGSRTEGGIVMFVQDSAGVGVEGTAGTRARFFFFREFGVRFRGDCEEIVRSELLFGVGFGVFGVFIFFRDIGEFKPERIFRI
jgi:hypothetical protein